MSEETQEKPSGSDTMNSLVREELCLLRKIADEAKKAWDKGILTSDETRLKNLLTDRIHFQRNVSR